MGTMKKAGGGGSLSGLKASNKRVGPIDPKTGKTRGTKRERNTYSTEISLTGEDVTRFNNLNN